MAKGLINKNGMKNFGKVLVPAVLRGAAAVGTSYAATTLIKEEKLKMKIKGPAAFVLGILGEAYLNDDNARAIAQGVGTAGMLHTAGAMFPESKPKFGLGGVDGIGDVPLVAWGEPSSAPVSGFGAASSWEAAAAQLQAMSGVDERGYDLGAAENILDGAADALGELELSDAEEFPSAGAAL